MKQKICAVITLVLLIIGAGAIEGKWWFLTPICLIGMAVCVLIGDLSEVTADE